MELKIGAPFFFFSLLFLFLCRCELAVSSTSIHDFLPSDPIFASTGLASFRQQSGCSGHGCGVVAVEDAEFQLDSEINRRLLADGNGGYNALIPDKATCPPNNGKTYNNCLPPHNSVSNPRGCTDYYRVC